MNLEGSPRRALQIQTENGLRLTTAGRFFLYDFQEHV